MAPHDLIVDLVVRYGFQVIGAIVILAVGALVSRWLGRLLHTRLERQEMEPPMRQLIVNALRLVVMLFALVVALDKFGFQIAPLVAGIGVDKTGEADYYVMSEPSWSTFDKTEAEHQVRVTRGRISIKEVRKLPLLNVNDVMAEHFKGRAPTFLSIDAEGWHFAILKSIDFERFRPPVICVETLVSGESRTIPEIPAFMETRDYVDRGGSFVNTIFVDAKLL